MKYVRSDRVGLAWKEAKNIKIRKSVCRKDVCARRLHSRVGVEIL